MYGIKPHCIVFVNASETLRLFGHVRLILSEGLTYSHVLLSGNINVDKGSFTIINIYEIVQRVLFFITPSPLPKAYSKMLIFFKIIILTTC